MNRPAGFGALRVRGFAIYSIGNGLSSIGLWVQRLAIGWLAWTLTGSELWVGLIAFALFAPILFLSPLFGVLIDRMDPRRASLAINGLMMSWAALLALTSAAGALDIRLLFTISLAIGTTSAAYTPTRLSVIPSLVPRALLPSAVAYNSLIFNGSRLIGPAIAGVILANANPAWAFALNAGSYVPLLAALLVIEMAPRAPSSEAAPAYLRELTGGFAHAWSNRLIRWQLLLAGWGTLFGRSVLELLPVYADRLYAKGAGALAALTAAAGLGALFSALLALRSGVDSGHLRSRTILLNLLGAGALLALPFSHALPFGLVAMGLIGFTASGSAILSQTLVQLEVEDRFRGRVSSLWGMVTIGGAALGSVTLGSLLDIAGVAWATWISGMLALIVPLWALWGGGPDVRPGRRAQVPETALEDIP